MRKAWLRLCLLVSAPAFSQVLFSSGLENESMYCWNYGRDSNGYKIGGCGDFSYLGKWPLILYRHAAWFGRQHAFITYLYNEDEGFFLRAIAPQEEVYVRAYYAFSGTFDFPQGLKLGKVRGPTGVAGQSFDFVLQSQAPHKVDGYTQEGMSDNVYLGMFFNNPAPVGHRWDEVRAYRPIQRAMPHCIEYRVKMNTPGQSNGEIEVWFNGNRIAYANDRNLRPNSDWKITEVRFGSNWSNAANENPYLHPDGGPYGGASDLSIDEVAISTSRIGCL